MILSYSSWVAYIRFRSLSIHFLPMNPKDLWDKHLLRGKRKESWLPNWQLMCPWEAFATESVHCVYPTDLPAALHKGFPGLEGARARTGR